MGRNIIEIIATQNIVDIQMVQKITDVTCNLVVRNIIYEFSRVRGDVRSLFCRNMCWKISASVYGGSSRGSHVRRPGSEDPISASLNFSVKFPRHKIAEWIQVDVFKIV